MDRRQIHDVESEVVNVRQMPLRFAQRTRLTIASERTRKDFVPGAEAGTRAVSDDLKQLGISIKLDALAIFGRYLFEFRIIKKIRGLGWTIKQTLLCAAGQSQEGIARCTRWRADSG